MASNFFTQNKSDNNNDNVLWDRKADFVLSLFLKFSPKTMLLFCNSYKKSVEDFKKKAESPSFLAAHVYKLVGS